MAVMNKKKRKAAKENGDKEASPPAKKSSSNPKLETEIEPTEVSQIKDADPKSALKFDIKHFRKGLSIVSTRLVGLTQFLNVCNNDGSVDYIMKYLESGGSPGEILKQLEGQSQKDLILATTVFNIFHLIILKIQSSAAHLLQSIEDTCRYFLNTYVPTIELMLNEKSNPKQQRVALKLLTSIVTLNSELGLTVLNQLTLQPKMLRHLVKRQSAKDDVRTSFIQFLMSFLIDGNTTLVKTILDKHGLIALIIPDLSRDGADVVLIVLRLLKTSVLNNASISKTLKICTFTHQVISYIFNLFNWKKHASNSNDCSEEGDEIDKAVDELLCILFTSHKYGIYFTDKTLGSGDVPKNKYLWKAIESLEAPWNNDSAGRCIINILSKSPDLYRPIRGIIEESFDANKTEQWFKTVTFLKSVLMSVDPKRITSTDSDVSSLMNFIRHFYLPSVVLKTSMTVLKSTENVMRNEIVIVLSTILKCIKSYLNESDQSLKRVRINLKNRLEETIPKVFPSVDLLILTLHSVLDKVAEESDGEIPTSKLLLNVLDLLLLYNDLVPNSFDPVLTMLDTKRLFEKIEFLDADDRIELKLKTTSFLLCADRFALAPDKPLFKEILPGMFEVLISNDVQLVEVSRDVLRGILDTTGIFDGNKSEIDAVLYATNCTSKKYGTDVVPMIVDVLEAIILNDDKYKKQLKKISVDSNEYDLKSIENFDIIFDNLERYNKNKEELHFVEDRPYFTHFIIGLLKNVKKLVKVHECLQDFSDQFVVCLLHFQDNPDRFYDIVKEFKLDDYVSSWKSDPISVGKNVFDKKTRMFKLSRALLSDSELDTEEVFKDCNTDLNQSELNVLLNTVLFYVIQQQRLNTLNHPKLTNAKRALFFIFESCLSSSTTSYMDGIRRCLGNGDLLLNFAPFESTQSHLTKFVVDVVAFCRDKDVEKTLLELVLKPYRHKIYLILAAETLKGKGIKFDNVEEVLKSFKLDSNDASLLLSAVLDMNVSCMETSANEASSWIYIICHIIDLYVQNNIALNLKTFTDVTNLYSKIITELNSIINVSELERSMYEYLLAYPDFIEAVPGTVFETMFAAKHVGKYTAKLAGVLLQSNSNLLNKFCKCVVNEDVLSKREFTIPLTLIAFHHSRFKYNLEVLNAIYKYYKSNIAKIVEKPQKATQIYVDNVDLFVKLVYYCMDVAECDTFLKKVHKFDAAEVFHIHLLEAMFFKHSLADKSNINLIYIENFLLTIFQLSVVALKRDDPSEDKILKISSTLNQLMVLAKGNDFSNIIKSTTWQNFFKAILKSFVRVGEHNSDLIKDVAQLIDLMYPVDDSGIAELFDVTTSHSEFLNVMLNNQASDTKTHLVSLLFVMVSKNKNVMKASHIPVYLSAYQATRNRSDRTLLSLLKLYESSGQSMIEYRPYLWSDVGANHFALRSSRKKATLWGNPTVNHVLNLLDREIIEHTIKHFPIDTELNSDFAIELDQVVKVIDDQVLNLNTSDVQELVRNKMMLPKFEQCSSELKRNDCADRSFESTDYETYDPSFMMPLLSYILAPGSAVSCHRILRGGVLAMPLMALSSHCPIMRSAAYNVLYRFYSQLEAEIFYKNDKLLWTQFLDTIRCSLNTAVIDEGSSNTPRLPAVCALYLARAAIVMTNPLDPLFKPINNFIISKQYVNFSVVPDLLDLFHNTDITYAERRLWILEVLRDGIRTFDDVKVLLKSVTFKILFDYYSCSLADAKTRSLILDILNASIRIPRAAKILTDGYGLIPWLNTTFKNQESKEITSKNIQLVHNLFISLVLDSAAKILNGYEKDSLDLILTGKCFKISEVIQSEILFLLLGLLDRLSSTTVANVKTYLYVLKKLSGVTVKQLSSVQIAKLVRECESVVDPSKKHCRTIILAISGKKPSLLSTSLALMDNIKSPTDGETSVKYLHNIVLSWLS